MSVRWDPCGCLRALAGAGVLAAALVACGGNAGSGSATRVQVTLGDFFLSADPTAIATGKVVFDITNTAATAHEFVVLQTDTPADQLAVNDTTANETGKVSEVDEFKGPNGTKHLTRDLKAGRYVLICNVSGHYQQGMRAAFTVQ
jgi:uncharacterized cupredoxin-like copper-binding protein